MVVTTAVTVVVKVAMIVEAMKRVIVVKTIAEEGNW